ncbi:MAG: 50S ribosomal protein L35 [Chloroflexi bacterium]|nr:50S ribosomal protein L35 [Chloroflexota bacterium]
MPKLKTHKGAKARFRVTPTGKILRTKGGKSHLRRNKPKRVRRLYDSMLAVSPRDKKRISALIPYGA